MAKKAVTVLDIIKSAAAASATEGMVPLVSLCAAFPIDPVAACGIRSALSLHHAALRKLCRDETALLLGRQPGPPPVN